MSLVVRFAILISTFHFLRICELAEYQPDQIYAMSEKRGEVKACGPILADLLAVTCGSKYYYNKGKRTDYRFFPSADNVPDSDYYNNYEPYPVEVLGAYRFRSKRSVSSMLRSTKRAHGLADECCKKSCTMDELRSYCGV